MDGHAEAVRDDVAFDVGSFLPAPLGLGQLRSPWFDIPIGELGTNLRGVPLFRPFTAVRHGAGG